jgi:hypothetical protein
MLQAVCSDRPRLRRESASWAPAVIDAPARQRAHRGGADRRTACSWRCEDVVRSAGRRACLRGKASRPRTQLIRLSAAALWGVRLCARELAPPKPSLSALANHVAVKLCERSEQVEYQPALRRRCVDGIVQVLETHVVLHQTVDDFDDMLERTSQSIELPDHYDVAGPHVIQEPSENGPLDGGATDDLGVHLGAARRLESVDLQGNALVACADASVADVHRRFCRIAVYYTQRGGSKSNLVFSNQWPHLGTP